MKLHLIRLENVPIFQQLELEEALLRADDRFFCLINTGSTPAVVMGISAKKEEVVNAPQAALLSMPLIRRFSGGGTVVVDSDTCFVSWIAPVSLAPCVPEAVHKFASNFYAQVFQPDFELKQNDYVFGNRKFGGNAQYFRKDRWLHHTSFLWDYSQERMDSLLFPPKTPKYREGRKHKDFLCCLKEKFESKELFLEKLKKTLDDRFEVQNTSFEEVQEVILRPHRKALTVLEN